MKNIHDDIEEWHTRYGGDIPLHVFLGMSKEVYGKFVEKKLTAEELAYYGYYED